MASQERSMPFIKNLASSDRKVRTSALASLHAFLSARQVASTLSPLDILKLWKGLFYALWMCDRAIPQQTLCAELADLIFFLPRVAVVPWLRGFWATMAREWTSIDVLRMEKFLLLVRRVVGAGFRWMKTTDGRGKQSADEKSWDSEKMGDIMGLLTEWPFNVEDEVEPSESLGAEQAALSAQTIPIGLRIHVLDIWVDEAEKVGLLEEDDKAAKEFVARLVEKVDVLERTTVNPGVRIRAKESLSDERLSGKKEKEEPVAEAAADTKMADTGDSGSWDGFED
ncbi:ribosomal RNA-processing protein 1 [Echria macrotheca]|uniref:Ribosomal RNA-processing protein 1 n=1 Tax=Echria macrotheca TaxID=438768 RepID=A0AAJ0BL81_9PEZI|nr:ribosomal RNA-processing protein 1 [Echria macrotheca]